MDSRSQYQTDGSSDHQLDQQRPVHVFSQEELNVLKECNRESFLFRSIPFGTVLGSATYIALSKGMLKPSPRLGFLPKVLGASFVGYILGKFSYQETCVEKILQLPNSKLAEGIRKNRGLRMPAELEGVDSSGGSNAADEVFTNIPQKPIFDDHKPDERDRNEGLDEYQRVTDSLSEYTLPVDGSAGLPVLSYDERRRLNREEYNSKTAERLRRPGGQLADLPSSPPPSPSPSYPPPLPSSSPSSPPPSVGRRNKYGDIVYE